jgi:hypothetical protein
MPWSTVPTCTRSSVWRAERGKLSKEDIVTARANGKLANRERLIYRTATGLVLAVMVFSIVNFVFNDHFPYTLVITILMEVKPF